MTTASDTTSGGVAATEESTAETAARQSSVLVVADHPNVGKIRRHYGPLADVVDETTMVCINGDASVDAISFREVPAPGHRLVGLPLLFLVGLFEAVRGDYDAVVTISLLPYGLFGLAIGRLTGTPVHLGIIGADIDRHASAWYGAVPKAAFRRFDAVSVPGTAHVERLAEAGVDRDRTAVLTNAIDVAEFRPPPEGSRRDVDFLWVGRFSREKDPLRFVEALARLRARGETFDAVMVGAGDRQSAVREAVDRYDLTDAVTFTGWVDDPLAYYHRSKVFVLTSRRDAMPLTLVEAMATGVVPVVHRVGSVTDVVEHERNALVADSRRASRLADAMQRLLRDSDLRARLRDDATAVRGTHSFEAARADWRYILGLLED